MGRVCAFQTLRFLFDEHSHLHIALWPRYVYQFAKNRRLSNPESLRCQLRKVHDGADDIIDAPTRQLAHASLVVGQFEIVAASLPRQVAA
jgi:hypothetical protein